MDSTRVLEKQLKNQHPSASRIRQLRKRVLTGHPRPSHGRQGIALFMVISAVSVLSLLVTEFTYLAQLSQKLAFDGVDQVKAHYLAKSGVKISLLRLKAYQHIKSYIGGMGGGGGANPAAGGMPNISSMVPKSVLDKIWSFPFVYPIPSSIPGLGLADREAIEKFTKESALQGNFSAVIESESSRYNLNMILAPYAAPAPTPSVSPSPGPGGRPPGNPNPNVSPSPSPTPSFNPEEARKSLGDFMGQILNQKVESDPDFASEYRDLKLEELVDAIVAWADPTYQRQNARPSDEPPKGAPFYSLTELHLIPGMNDDLYNLITPNMTVSTTPGLNVNTLKDITLRALVPQITADELNEFFKYRDDPEEDHLFKEPKDFFKYLAEHVQALGGSTEQLEKDLQKRGIRIVVDELVFKITVKASVNQSSRLIEAWVNLKTPQKAAKPPGGGPPPNLPGGQENKADPGLAVIFMRIL